MVNKVLFYFLMCCIAGLAVTLVILKVGMSVREPTGWFAIPAVSWLSGWLLKSIHHSLFKGD